MKIINGPQDALASWLCREIELVPTANLRCIGMVDDNGVLLGVVGFDGYNGASMEMHVAARSKRWLNRKLLRAAFDYIFNVVGAKVAIGKVAGDNLDALRFDLKLGFELCATIPDGHPSGCLHVLMMRREQCRFLGERYGWEVQSSAAAGS